MNQDQPTKPKRGFASMDPEKQREIASKGGKAVPAEKRSFSQNSDLAAAGRKGGIRSHRMQEEKAVIPLMPAGGLRSPNHDALMRCQLMGTGEHSASISLGAKRAANRRFFSRFTSRSPQKQARRSQCARPRR